MDQKKVVEYIFFAVVSIAGTIVSAVGTIGVNYVQQISATMVKLTDNVIELNTKIMVLTNRMSQTDEYLKDHEIRLRNVETIKEKRHN